MTAESTTRREYSVSISKGAGLIEEVRCLLDSWNPAEPLVAFSKRVQEEGVLGKATAYRTHDIVTRVFAPRLLRPTNRPACLLRRVLASHMSRRVFTELFFVFTARKDPLVYDFTTRVYWPAVRKSQMLLGTDSVLAFLSEAHYEGRLSKQWSEDVSVRVARSVLALLRDFGFLRESVRTRKEIVDYRIADETVALLARELHESGLTDSAISSHPDWKLFGLTPSDVVERLDQLGEHRGVIVQRAGSVIHFTWMVKSIEELVDVLAR